MEKCLRVLKESNKSRFDRYSRQEQSIDHIPYYLSGLSRAHFSDNLSRNSCRLFICLRFKYRRLSNINSVGLVRASCALCLTVRTEKKETARSLSQIPLVWLCGTCIHVLSRHYMVSKPEIWLLCGWENRCAASFFDHHSLSKAWTTKDKAVHSLARPFFLL